MKKFNDDAVQMYVDSESLTKKIEELRKKLGNTTNPFIKIHNESRRFLVNGNNPSKNTVSSWQSEYKLAIQAIFTEIASFSESLEMYEKFENTYKLGIQLDINFQNQKLIGESSQITDYLSAESKEISPHISGRAARKYK